MQYQCDVVIVGAGAVGSSIARELAKYEIDVILIDKNEDVGGYASKCNSATLMCGADSPVGSINTKLTKAANRMYETITKELDVPYRQIGFLNVAVKDDEIPLLERMRKESVQNGVYDLVPLSASKAREMVPSLSENIVAGLYQPDEAIVDVFELVWANVENSVDNGVRAMFSTKAERIVVDKKENCVTSVITDKGTIKTRFVINAAAIYADELAKTAGICDYRNYPRTGQMYVLDKNLPYAPSCVVAPIPTPISRGKLITPTIHGNILVGPSAENGWDKDDRKTTKQILDEVISETRKMIPAIDPRDSVAQFTGVRPAIEPSDWLIRAVPEVKGYVEAVGINAGVSAGPAIAVHVREILDSEGLELRRKENFNPFRVGIRRFNEMSMRERSEYISKNPRYGNVICRCETVTEAEIIEAINRFPPAKSLDAIKRRLRAGMGRCQGGFCSPRIVNILARELNVPVEKICKNEVGSEILVGINRR